MSGDFGRAGRRGAGVHVGGRRGLPPAPNSGGAPCGFDDGDGRTVVAADLALPGLAGATVDARISELRDRFDETERAHLAARAALIDEIKATLPEPGEDGPRGLITQVVKASRWTRAQIDLIRAGKTG